MLLCKPDQHYNSYSLTDNTISKEKETGVKLMFQTVDISSKLILKSVFFLQTSHKSHDKTVGF